MSKVNFHQKALVVNGKNEFLVLKASYKNMQWDLPGGAVEIPEMHEDALRREINEESGISVKDIVPLSLETAYNKDTDEYVIFAGYTCKAVDEQVKLSSEHTEYRWVTTAEFLEMDTIPYLKDFVRKWQ